MSGLPELGTHFSETTNKNEKRKVLRRLERQGISLLKNKDYDNYTITLGGIF